MNMIETLREFRVAGYALFDLGLAVVFALIVGPFLTKAFLKYKIRIPLRSWVLWSVPFGIVVHLLVGQMTPMTRAFIDLHGHYSLKLIMVLLVLCGLWGAKRIERPKKSSSSHS